MPTVAYSIIIPVYNSHESLPELVERIDRVMRGAGHTYEIVFVDDASPNPASWRTLVGLEAEIDQVRVFRMMRNFGKQAALICGFEHMRGEYAVTMDDDLQHAPEDIPKLLAERHHDVVVASFRSKRHSLFKRTASKIKGWFDYKLIDKPRHLKMSPFKLFKAEVVEHMLTIRTAYPFIPALVFYVTRDVVNVEIEHFARKYGETTFTFKKMLRLFTYLIINNSSLVLRLVAILGVSMAVLSLGLGLYFLTNSLLVGTQYKGWTSTIVVMTTTSGMILFSIGVIGEYLIRIITGVEARPPYVLRKSSPNVSAD